jgi:hypothetical protein
MATARQRQRKLARAQFHQLQSRERRALQRRADSIAPAMERHVRRSAVVPQATTVVSARAGYESMTVAELRQRAKDKGIKRTSLMRKGALVDALMDQR